MQRAVKSISATAKTLNHKSVGVDAATTHIGAKIRTISRTAKLFGRKFLVFLFGLSPVFYYLCRQNGNKNE